ncbi:MAG: hypothetical protein R3C24_00585 [Cyanobacteriota/Melainabacteria group bacterium]
MPPPVFSPRQTPIKKPIVDCKRQLENITRLIHLAPGLAIGHYRLSLTAFAATFWLSET